MPSDSISGMGPITPLNNIAGLASQMYTENENDLEILMDNRRLAEVLSNSSQECTELSQINRLIAE